jgi:hypothetical protein
MKQGASGKRAWHKKAWGACACRHLAAGLRGGLVGVRQRPLLATRRPQRLNPQCDLRRPNNCCCYTHHRRVSLCSLEMCVWPALPVAWQRGGPQSCNGRTTQCTKSLARGHKRNAMPLTSDRQGRKARKPWRLHTCIHSHEDLARAVPLSTRGVEAPGCRGECVWQRRPQRSPGERPPSACAAAPGEPPRA